MDFLLFNSAIGFMVRGSWFEIRTILAAAGPVLAHLLQISIDQWFSDFREHLSPLKGELF